MYITFQATTNCLCWQQKSKVHPIASVCSQKTQLKVIEYDRDIICLPKEFSQGGKTNIPIPRRPSTREMLAKNGLIGKIRLKSDMSEDAIFDEIRSVFEQPMRGRQNFPFDILQHAGGGSKSLVVPAVSSSFHWTASVVAGKNSKSPIYILALEDIKVRTI